MSCDDSIHNYSPSFYNGFSNALEYSHSNLQATNLNASSHKSENNKLNESSKDDASNNYSFFIGSTVTKENNAMPDGSRPSTIDPKSKDNVKVNIDVSVRPHRYLNDSDLNAYLMSTSLSLHADLNEVGKYDEKENNVCSKYTTSVVDKNVQRKTKVPNCSKLKEPLVKNLYFEEMKVALKPPSESSESASPYSTTGKLLK